MYVQHDLNKKYAGIRVDMCCQGSESLLKLAVSHIGSLGLEVT